MDNKEITEAELAAKAEEKRRQLTTRRKTGSNTSKADDDVTAVIERMRAKAGTVEMPSRERCERCRDEIGIMETPLGDRMLWVCKGCLANVEAERRETIRRDAETAYQQTLRQFLNSPGAEEHQSSTLDSFRPDPDRTALAVARRFVQYVTDGHARSLYLYSEREGETIATGNGKTHLAVGIARELIKADKSVDIIRVNRLMLEVYRTFKQPDADALDVVKRYAQPDVLLLDDLGTEKWNEYNLSVLYEIIASRAHKVNVITSNYGLGYLEQADQTGYMPRITSRIAGSCQIVKLTGPDRRLNQE